MGFVSARRTGVFVNDFTCVLLLVPLLAQVSVTGAAAGGGCLGIPVDGNKRTAYVVCRTFLVLNGWDLVGTLAERYRVFIELADGTISETELAEWLRGHSRPQQLSEDIAPDWGPPRVMQARDR